MGIFYTVGFVLFLCLVELGCGDEYILYTALTNQTGYNTKVRPVIDHNQAITVNINMELLSIVDLDEKNELFTLFCFFVADWTDEHMTWVPASHGNIESIVLPPSEVWLPDMGIQNSAEFFYHETFRRDFHVRVFYTGAVVWSFGGEQILTCDLDMTYYPFDLQKCKVEIQNWAYHGREVLLRNSSDTITTDSYSTNGVWNLDSTAVSYEDVYIVEGGIPYPKVDFTMYLSRKPNYYVINLVVPSILIIMVALGVFWLPPESGEKVSLGITVLLAFSVYQIILADSMPVNSDYTPVLGQLVVCIMTLATLSVLTSIIVLYLHHKAVISRVPHKVKVVFFNGLARLLCMRSDVPDASPTQISPHDAEATDAGKSAEVKVHWPVDDEPPPVLTDHDLQLLANDLSYLAERARKVDKESELMEEWAIVARILDRFLFWVAVIYIVCILLFFMTRKDTTY